MHELVPDLVTQTLSSWPGQPRFAVVSHERSNDRLLSLAIEFVPHTHACKGTFSENKPVKDDDSAAREDQDLTSHTHHFFPSKKN